MLRDPEAEKAFASACRTVPAEDLRLKLSCSFLPTQLILYHSVRILGLLQHQTSRFSLVRTDPAEPVDDDTEKIEKWLAITVKETQETEKQKIQFGQLVQIRVGQLNYF